jgi:hypothetical protein
MTHFRRALSCLYSARFRPIHQIELMCAVIWPVF